MGEIIKINANTANNSNAISNGRQRRQEDTTKGELEVVRGREGSLSALSDSDLQKLNSNVTKILKDVGIDIPWSSKIKTDGKRLYIDVGLYLTIERAFDESTKTMKHELFDIDKEYQGKGISKAIHRALIPLYEKLGVEKITVFAALENGGYTWARYGFRVSKDEAKTLRSEARSHKADIDKVVKDYFDAHPHATRFPMNILASKPWAKEALSGATWVGSINLKDKQEKDDFYNYVGYKKR